MRQHKQAGQNAEATRVGRSTGGLSAVGRPMGLLLAAALITLTPTSAVAQSTQIYPPVLQPIPGPPLKRHGQVSMPFVRSKQPYVLNPAGNLPLDRTLPARLDPRGPNAPSPPVIQTPGEPNNQPVVTLRPGDVYGGPIMVGGINRYTSTTTGGAIGWSRPRESQLTDPRLSSHFRPSEIQPPEPVEPLRPITERAPSSLRSGDLDLAHELYDELVKTHPEDLTLARSLGMVELLQRQTDAGVKRLAALYAADPMLAERPVDPETIPGGKVTLRRLGSEVANLGARANRPDASLVAALLAHFRGDLVVANRFIAKAEAEGLDPVLAARVRAEFVPQQPPLPKPGPTQSGPTQPGQVTPGQK